MPFTTATKKNLCLGLNFTKHAGTLLGEGFKILIIDEGNDLNK